MKRPPGIWLLLSAGVLWLSIQNVYGLKATSLIFGKSTTTTTTTEAGENKDDTSTETSVEENTIKSNLTGNPQLDYIYDPNLPRELNGYNLSSYPFFNSMPEDIVFKCDGLHDGFYASVPHKCQVYHHCLFGTRFDFLCANYTAFDQKTFICHFVSEVDCVNSHKYWHRNDALYQAASTTTTPAPTPIVISPALTASPRRPPPPLRRRKPLRRRPQYEYYDEEYDEEREDDYEEPPPRRRRKRPRPRRPSYEDDYEYEDDRFERRMPGRRHEDDDDDDRKPYNRRESDTRQGGDSDRKQHDDRRDSSDTRGDKDKKLPNDDRRVKEDDDRKSHDRKETDDRPSERKHFNRREPEDRRNGSDGQQYDRREYDDRRYDDRPIDNKRYKEDRRRDYDDRGRYDKDDEDFRYDRDRKRRPDDDLDDRRPSEKRPVTDRRSEKRRPADDSGPYDRPRKGHRKPYDDDPYEDDREDDRRVHSRPRKTDSRDDDTKPDPDEAPLVKPSSGSSVFNQRRMPPKIRPPVAKTEQGKLSFKGTTEKPALKNSEDEDDYEYEDEPPKRSNLRPNRKTEPETSESRRPNKPSSTAERDERRDNRRPLGSASRPRAQMSKRPPADSLDDYEDDKPRTRPHSPRPRYDAETRDSKISLNNRNRASLDEASTTEKEDTRSSSRPTGNNRDRNTSQNSPKFVPKEQRGRSDYRDKSKTEFSSSTTTTTTSTSTTTTTKEPPRQRSEPFVKVVKRPFLPSRGGSPYSARGLQPVGAKAVDSNLKNSSPIPEESDVYAKETDYRDNSEPETPQKSNSRYQSDNSKPITEDYDEPKQTYKVINAEDEQVQNNRRPTTENFDAVQNGRQFPTSTETKTNSFLINEQPVDKHKQSLAAEVPTKQVYEPAFEAREPEPPEEKPFKPSPTLVKVPIRLKYSDPINNEDEEEFHPVSNRPQSSLRQNNKPSAYQESRITEKPLILEKNPLDITENEYDVTLNDALNPTIPNLPVRNFPSGFNTATDYTFSSFHRPGYDVTLNQATENRYQVRAPSQRVETVAEPYVNRGDHKYVTINTQYNPPADQIYQNQNFRTSPQLTQAQTHAYYNVY